MPSSFNIDYANERIDYITQTFKTMVDLYKQSKDTSSAEDIANLIVLHTSVHTEISNYYRYLRETGISAEESYLTKWILAWEYYEYSDEIEHFLHTQMEAQTQTQTQA